MYSHKKEMNMHKVAIEKIANNPGKIGIKGNIVGVCLEKKLYDIKKGIRYQIAQPDIIFELSTGEIIIIEYKNNGNCLEKAQQQLARAVSWYARYTNIPLDKIKTRVVYGDTYSFLKKL